MTMPCRITDEFVYNPWEAEEMDEKPTKSLEECTLYDLMAEEMGVWVGKNKEFGYVLEIENEEGEQIIEKCIHPYAMESFATFCRRFLSFYDKISGE